MSKANKSETNKDGRLRVACTVAALGLGLYPPAHAAPKQEAAPKPKATSTMGSAKKPPVMTLFPAFALDVGNTKLVYTISVNGWVVDTSPGNTNGHFSSTRVGEYIADGDNVVAVHLSAPDPKFLSSFAILVRTTGNPQLFDYGWDPGNPKHPLPVQEEGHFTTHLPTGPWAWQTAPKITLDAPTKAAINAHLKRLFDALNTKNIKESVALFAPRNHEEALALGRTAAEADQDSREGWKEDFTSPGWHLYPIDYPRLRYELVANGRVVHVLRSDGGVPLINATADSDGLHTSYDIYLCLVHGQWTVIW